MSTPEYDMKADVSVEFNLCLEPTAWNGLLNAFLTFQRNDSGALGPRALAARESGQVARRTRASVGEKRGAEEEEEEDKEEIEDEDGECVPVPDPEDIPEGPRRELFQREILGRELVLKWNGRWVYYEESEFELEGRPKILSEAFRLAMEELVGVGNEWAENIVIRTDAAGGLGEPRDLSLRLAYKVRSPSPFLLSTSRSTPHD